MAIEEKSENTLPRLKRVSTSRIITKSVRRIVDNITNIQYLLLCANIILAHNLDGVGMFQEYPSNVYRKKYYRGPRGRRQTA